MVQSLEMSIFHVCRTPMENDALKELLEKSPGASRTPTSGSAIRVRCGDEIKRFFHVFLGIQDRMVFGV